MTRTTADDVSALMRLRKHAAAEALAWVVTGFPDGPVSVALHRPDALHSRALAHGTGGSIAEAVREAMKEQSTMNQNAHAPASVGRDTTPAPPVPQRGAEGPLGPRGEGAL